MEIKSNGTFGKYGKSIFFVLGTAFISLGFVLLIQFNALYDFVVENAMEFTPESQSFKAWRKNDPPLPLKLYLFNWTNPQDLRNPAIKPRFEEIGPYTFLETKEKVNITWHENNTISYRYVKRYYHVEDESGRKLTDKITTINHVALTAAYRMRRASYLFKLSSSFTLFSLSPIYITKTAGELLFDGYEDYILQTGRMLNRDVPDRFGFFYKRNGTISKDELEMHTGIDEKFGKLVTCNHRNHSSIYEGQCGEIRGSAGEFHPINSAPTFIEAYSAEICSYARFDYERNVTIKEVNAYKYGSRTLFDNGTLLPENACFCNGVCLPSGVRNVSACRAGSPTFLSLPHFYNADPYYTSLIDGMKPDKEKHELYLTLEPKSSIIVDYALRMQINMLLQPIAGLSLFTNVPTSYIPLFYYDQNVTMSDRLAAKIKTVQNLPELAKIASVGMIISGGIVIGISILMFVFVRDRKVFSPDLELKKPSCIHDNIPVGEDT